jgi:membrane fusion protein
VAALDAQMRVQREIVASTLVLLEQISDVVEKGYVTRVEQERRRQTHLNARQVLTELEQQKIAAQSQESDARAQAGSLDVAHDQEIAQLRSGVEALEQQRAQFQGEREFVLRAPITGVVTAVQAGIGRSAMPGRPIMTIVPAGSELRAEIYAPSRAIGLVQPGQETRLLYDAFPYQRFGSFGGRVESISRTIIDPRETDIPLKLEEPVYRISVIPDESTVEAFGQRAPLQPGMTLRANIVLERQSFLDWLLAPLRAVLNRN